MESLVSFGHGALRSNFSLKLKASKDFEIDGKVLKIEGP